jgi:hypothetical protein
LPKRKRRKSKDEWTITDWEKWLWPIFSNYIRIRDCLITTGTTWKAACVTCGKIYRLGKQLQAGHFIPGRTRAILFDERCVHAQCYRCNHKLQGNWPPYYRFMQKVYGQNVIEELIDLWGQDLKLEPKWFEEAYEYYSWAVDFMRENQQLIESDTSKIATG